MPSFTTKYRDRLLQARRALDAETPPFKEGRNRPDEPRCSATRVDRRALISGSPMIVTLLVPATCECNDRDHTGAAVPTAEPTTPSSPKSEPTDGSVGGVTGLVGVGRGRRVKALRVR